MKSPRALSRKIRLFFVLFLLLLVVSPVNAQISNPFTPFRPFVRSYQFTASGQDSVFYIDSTIVAIDTVVVHFNHAVLPQEYYLYEPRSGVLILTKAPLKGAVIKIHGFVSPFSAGTTYFSRKPIVLKKDEPVNSDSKRATALPAPVATPRSEESAFYKSGSLSRAFSFGTNRGLELQSSLNMQILGKLGKDYELQAVLTDQNTPLQPEGNTRTLQELDKVYINISGPGITSRFGDIYIERNSTEFGQFNRKLTGITINSRIGANDVSLSFATTQGQFHTIMILGIEGSQGPYMLTGKNGERDIIVLAGTERVYVDGSLMTRGEDQDYIIDYASARITFTRNRLITGDSRIVSDFQYSGGNYKKSFYSLGVEKKLPSSGLSYSLSYSREGDDKENPRNASFSGSDLAYLASAGDNPLQAYRTGVEYVGSKKGTYKKVIGGGKEYFVYSDSADFKVIFSDVGEGNGDYSFQRLGVYDYVGENGGRFKPVVLLPLPGTHSLTDFSIGYADGDRRFRINAEYAYSMLDKNIFSDRDDNDNGGGALAVEFVVDPSELSITGRKIGTASLRTRIRQTAPSFTSIDRNTEVEYDRKWDLDSQTVSGEKVFELEGEYRPRQFISIKPAIGFFTQGNGFRSSRQAAQILMQHNYGSKVDYVIENISSTKNGIQQNWIRQKGAASYQFKGVTPTLYFESETKSDNQNEIKGFSFNNVSGKLQYNFRNSIMAYSMVQIRRDKKYQEGILQPLSRAENRIFHLEVRQGRRLFSQIHIVNRNRIYNAQSSRFGPVRDGLSQREGLRFRHEPACAVLGATSSTRLSSSKSVESLTLAPSLGSSRIRTSLADIKIQSSELNSGLITRFDLQVSRESIPEKELIYLPVEDGRGYYSYDDRNGEYFPDSNGNYELRTFTTDILHAVKRKKIGLVFNFDPSRFIGTENTTSLARTIRTALNFRYEDSGRDSNELENIDDFRKNALFKLVSFNQDIFVLERNTKFNLRIRHSYRKTLNNQYVARNEEQKSKEYSVRIRSQIDPGNRIEANLGFTQTQKNIDAGSRSRYNIGTVKGEVIYSLKPDMNWRLFFTVLGARQLDRRQKNTEVQFYSFYPGFERAFLGSGRLSGNFQWFNVRSNQGKYLPFEFAEGKQPGNNFSWKLAFEYRTAQNFIVSINYLGSKNTRYDKIFNNLRAELQVLF